MLFNSFEYLIFLPVVVALYFAIPVKWRWLLLLDASSALIAVDLKRKHWWIPDKMPTYF